MKIYKIALCSTVLFVSTICPIQSASYTATRPNCSIYKDTTCNKEGSIRNATACSSVTDLGVCKETRIVSTKPDYCVKEGYIYYLYKRCAVVNGRCAEMAVMPDRSEMCHL